MNEKSQLITKCQRYEQVMEYESMPPVPPPFTCLVHLYILGKSVYRLAHDRRIRRYMFDCGLSETFIE